MRKSESVKYEQSYKQASVHDYIELSKTINPLSIIPDGRKIDSARFPFESLSRHVTPFISKVVLVHHG